MIGVWQLPVIGELVGLISLLYVLMRDMNGASIGKLLVGIRVTSSSGAETTIASRVIRNISLALPQLALIVPIPGVDILLNAGVTTLVFLLEGTLLLATGRRIGDRVAGTAVLKKVKR